MWIDARDVPIHRATAAHPSLIADGICGGFAREHLDMSIAHVQRHGSMLDRHMDFIHHPTENRPAEATEPVTGEPIGIKPNPGGRGEALAPPPSAYSAPSA
jgi:hypothetical protein